jgi:hypothetical protein
MSVASFLLYGRNLFDDCLWYPGDYEKVRTFMVWNERQKLLNSMSFEKRVLGLGSPFWKAHMHMMAYQFMTERESLVTLPVLEKQLSKFENVERMTLLNLAIWKSECIMEGTFNNFRDYLGFLEWTSSGWKTLKTDVYNRSSTRSVIGALVLPYLEKR